MTQHEIRETRIANLRGADRMGIANIAVDDDKSIDAYLDHIDELESQHDDERKNK